jgi:heavy metal translocating P-type ATPase
LRSVDNVAGTSNSPPRPLGARLRTLAPLGLAVVALCAGGVLHWLGVGRVGDVVWVIVACSGIVRSLVSMYASIRRGRLGVDVIALLALGGAVAVREYLASAIISVMLATGWALEAWAAGQARRELAALMERAPKSARRYRGGGLESIELDAVAPGDRLMVASGELVPVDGTIASDSAVLDESALTGESLPVERPLGDMVRSGVVNAGRPFDMRATTSANDSTYAGVVRLVSQAEASQAPFVRLADRYAFGFLLVTLVVGGLAWIAGGASRAVAVLVVATPCPLILAAPVAFVSGLSRGAHRGIIIKGGAVLERLATCATLLVDKTGTVTVGRPTLVEVVGAGVLPIADVLTMAASLDQMSPHVLASAVVRTALEREYELVLATDVTEVAGLGIRGNVSGHRVSVGNAAWTGVVGTPAWAKSANRKAHLDGAISVFVAVDDVPAGVLVFNDPLRPDAARMLRSLRGRGIDRILMITGDRVAVAETVGAVIGVDDVLAECSPQDKLDVVRLETLRAPTIMVGDGINDAPALALADVGVAMGARGASAASEAADIVITVDRLDRLGEAVDIARRTKSIATQSMVAGMAMSLLAMAAAALGLLPAVWGALLQEGIDATVILNALRALGGARGHVRLTTEDSALTRRFSTEHREIREITDQLRVVADGLTGIDPAQSLARVRDVHHLLVTQVQPHEEAEENVLYPAISRFLGGDDPLGTMSRAHVEIAHRIRRLGQFIEEIDPEGIDELDLAELRGMLYGLHAILTLHTAQEEESYLSLADEPEPSTLAPNTK